LQVFTENVGMGVGIAGNQIGSFTLKRYIPAIGADSSLIAVSIALSA
jgi:hypothetical protein